MKSESYRFRQAKVKFRTHQLAIRGFARELKSRLLEGETFSLHKQEYSRVAAAFSERIIEKLKESGKGISEKIAFEQFSFVDSSCFSKWWNGKQYPSPLNREAIDILYPGLTAKWFDRSKFENRMQLHLASLDLFHLSRNCSCQVSEQSLKSVFTVRCENCLLEALNEAAWILSAIHNDWRPTHTGYLKAYDVCISGPQSRSGLNVVENQFKSISNPEIIDHRESIDYDLSLGDTSFVGLPLPKEVVDLYQDQNPFSIVLFMFILVSLDLKTESEYRDDLILDFMTALNCAGLLLYAKHGKLFSNQADFTEEKLQKIFLHASEYFYNQPPDLNEELLDYKEPAKKVAEKEDALERSIVYPITHLFGHPGFELSELFFGALRFAVKDHNIVSFMENLEGLSHSNSYPESTLDEYLKPPYLGVIKSLNAARERYLNLFDIVGYSRTELITELNKTVCNPISIRLKSGPAIQKRSAYTRRMSALIV